MGKKKETYSRWKNESTAVKIIFGVRAILWIVALAFTLHWTHVSFDLYKQGIFDPHDYATILRPILYRDVLISVAAIVVSFIFRSISDKIKEVNKMR